MPFVCVFQVSECGWPIRKAPTLANLFSICSNMHLWLRHNPKNICVIHCLDGKASSATVVGAFLAYCRLFESASAAMHIFTARRAAPGITASQKRYCVTSGGAQSAVIRVLCVYYTVLSTAFHSN